MPETYAKLFSSITTSTIWAEDNDTRILWITMLAMADKHGYVGGSIPGLATYARIPIEAVERGLAKFLAPDRYSRSREHDGRRIEATDRGWNILNYDRFRDMRDEEARREYERQRKAEQRAKAKAAALVPDGPAMSRDVPAGHALSAEASASASATTDHDLSHVPSEVVGGVGEEGDFSRSKPEVATQTPAGDQKAGKEGKSAQDASISTQATLPGTGQPPTHQKRSPSNVDDDSRIVAAVVMAWNKAIADQGALVARDGVRRGSSVWKAILARIGDDHPRLDPAWWAAYFERVAASDFLAGRKTSWRATFDWTLGPKNMEKVLQGNYDNRTDDVQTLAGERPAFVVPGREP